MDLQYLLDNYRTGTLSDEEKLQLLSALEDRDLRAQWEGLMAKLYEEASPSVDYRDAGVEEMIRSILEQSAQPGIATSVVMPDTSARRMFVRGMPARRLFTATRILTAAAASLILVVVSLYFLLRDNPKPRPPEKQLAHKRDIMPGGNHAVLTLANGQQIILDSIGSGSLGTQGGARITKINAGSLSYHATTGDPSRVFYNTIATPAGGQYQVTLADGSLVWLNALSSLKFPTSFNGTDRSVEVTGEAYFEIAKNVSKPFIVHVDQSDIEVLGTHFNVMAYNNESALETTLLEGSVRFKKGNSNVLLKPGQQSRLLPDARVQLVGDVNLEQVVAWKNGMQSFNSADIRTIMRQVERWYDVKVEYKGGITTRKFTGDIPREAKLSELLELFKINNVHFDIDPEHKKLTIMQ